MSLKSNRHPVQGKSRKTTSGRRRGRRKLPVRLEQLEDRRLLATMSCSIEQPMGGDTVGQPVPMAAALALDLVEGPPTESVCLDGTASGDNFVIERDALNLNTIVWRDDTKIYEGVPTELTIHAADGDDTLTIDFDGGDLDFPITFNGQGQASATGDAIVLQGGGTFEKSTYNYVNENDGSIAITGNGLITYTGLEPITSTISPMDVELNFSQMTETITVTDVGSDETKVNSDVGGETTTFVNPKGTLTINAGTVGNDTVNVESLAANYPASVTINGQGAGDAGTDTVIINDTVSLMADKSLIVNADTINLPSIGSVSASGTGAITLTADRNIEMESGSSLMTASGAITLKANEGGTATGNFSGISLEKATIKSTDGAISLTGVGGDSGGGNHGVAISGSDSVVRSQGGDISIKGTGGSTEGSFNMGVLLNSGGVVESRGAAKVTLVGTGGGTGTGNSNHGVSISGLDSGSDSVVRSQVGDISIKGTGGATTGDRNLGVFLDTGGVVESRGTTAGAAAKVTLVGAGGGTGDSNSNNGVVIFGSDSVVRSQVGDISIKGTGGSTKGSFNLGVVLSAGGVVESRGTTAGAAAKVTLVGAGGGTGVSVRNAGVVILDSGSVVRSQVGDISIKGTGGSTKGSFNLGVVLSAGGVVESRGTTAGAAAKVTLVGAGGGTGDSVSNYGVAILESGSVVRSKAGDLSITGTGGAGANSNHGFVLQNMGQVGAAGAGNIVIKGIGGAGTSSSVSFLTADTLISTSMGTIEITGASGPVTTPSGVPASDLISGGPLSISGKLKPGGDSPGVLPVGANTKLLGDTFTVDIKTGTPSAGVTFDQLDVTGTVVIGSSVDLVVNATDLKLSDLDNEYPIVLNDGIDMISGQFNGLAEGAIVVSDVNSLTGVDLGITYKGGPADGNDVVLRVGATTEVSWTDGNLLIKDAMSVTDDDLRITMLAGPGDYVKIEDLQGRPINVTSPLESQPAVSGDNTHTVIVPLPPGPSSQIVFDTGKGDDHVHVDYSGPAFPSPIVYDGGDHTQKPSVIGDRLSLENASVTKVDHTFMTESSGGVMVDGHAITYSNLEPVLTDKLVAVKRSFTFEGDSEIIKLTSSPTTGTTHSIDSDSWGLMTAFPLPSGSLTVHATTESDALTVDEDIDGPDVHFNVPNVSLDAVMITGMKSGTATYVNVDPGVAQDGIAIASPTAPATVDVLGDSTNGLNAVSPIDKAITYRAGGFDTALIEIDDLILNSNDTLEVDIHGIAGAGEPGGHDVTKTVGTIGVHLDGASLDIRGGKKSLAAGLSFLLLDNGSMLPVAGTFAGRPEGSPVTVGGQEYQITYVGGDGNDVALISNVLVEFDGATTSSDEHASAADAKGPTVVVQGDLTHLSESQRTLSYLVTDTETTAADTETTAADLKQNTFVIPAANYKGGTDVSSRFDLIKKSVLVIQNDALLEGDEAFRVTLSNDSPFKVGDANDDGATFSVVDHDILDNEVGTLSIVSANKPESTTTVETKLTITGTTSGTAPYQLAPEVTLSAKVVDQLTGTANPNPAPMPNSDDYDYVPGTAVFAPGTATGSTRSVPLNVLPELLIEPNETIDFELQNLSDGRTSDGSSNLNGHASSLGSDGTVTILNDDSASVIVEHSGSSTDVTEGGATDTYTVRLGGIPTVNVPLVVWPQASQLDLGNGPGAGTSVTFTPFNALMPQTVTVTAIDDVIVEGPHSDLIGHLATGLDPYYMGLPIVNLPVNVIDNDNTATPAIVLGDSAVSVTEGGATDTYTVSLPSVPTGDVAVTITPDAQLDLGAGAGTAVTLNFTPGTALTPQTVTVVAVDDAVIEGAHFGSITHSSTSVDASYDGIVGSGISVLITDNDVAVDPFLPTDISIGSSSWAGTAAPYQLTNNLSHTGTSGHHGRTLSWVNLDTITVAYTGQAPVSGDLVLSDGSLGTTFVGASNGTATWTVADASNPLNGVVAGVTTQMGPKDDLTVTAGGSLAVTVDIVPGDINTSFGTDIGDILAWITALGTSTPATAAPDFSDVDGSGLTDVGDVYAIILANGAASTPVAAALDSVFADQGQEVQESSVGIEGDSSTDAAEDLTSRRRSRQVTRRGRGHLGHGHRATPSQSLVETANVDDVFAGLNEQL